MSWHKPAPGGSEKLGNTAWVACPRCAAWFPVSPGMLEPAATECICPVCHASFRPREGAPQTD